MLECLGLFTSMFDMCTFAENYIIHYQCIYTNVTQRHK